MATREENLKKINAELNKLSDDELDKVAGGCIYYSICKQQQLETFDDCPETVEPFMCPEQPEAFMCPDQPEATIISPPLAPGIKKEKLNPINPTIDNSNLTKINE